MPAESFNNFQGAEGKQTIEPRVEVEVVENVHNANISTEHREYLLQRHQTLSLDPLPSEDPDDPLNWSAWKKNVNLALVAFHGLMCTATAVGAVPAFEEWSKTYHVSVTAASYLGTSQLITLAVGPFFWIPVSDRFGRRPVWIISVLLAGLFNVGCALSKNYGTHLAMRILVAFCISPGIALGQVVVVETFFKSQRAQKIGVWTLLVNIGVSLGPFTMGFVIQHQGWRWMYWIEAIINLAQGVLYIILSPETLFIRHSLGRPDSRRRLTFKQIYPPFCRFDSAAFRLGDFLEPFLIFRNFNILAATIAYSIVFNFVLVMLAVEIPVLFGSVFHLNAQQIGINFLGLFVGSLLGEQIGGPLSDYFQNRHIARNAAGRTLVPEDRLWVAQLGFPFVIAGLVIFLVRMAEAQPLHWNISPIIGSGLAAFGMQIVTTVVVTYCSDSYIGTKSSAVGAAINFVRLAWGFIGPFWYPHMINSCGLRGSAGVITGIVILFSILPIAVLQILGRDKDRKAQRG